MKYRTYVISFIAYVAIHFLRMGYSSVKSSFQITFGLDSIFLGLFDGLIYISLGLGYFFRFLIEGKTKKTKMYLIFGITTASAYAVIPLISMLKSDETGTLGQTTFMIQKGLPGLALIIFGFCQFTSWPILLYLVNQHFSSQKQGTLVGIWSANGDVGNIIGFFVGGLILNQLHLRWEYVMFIGSIFHFSMSIIVFFTLHDEKQKSQVPLLSPQDQKISVSRMDKFKQFISYSKQIIMVKEYLFYIMAFSILKSILYGFLLWIPTYLKHKQENDLATYVSILCNACTVIGSAFLGYFYKTKERITRDQYDQLSKGSKFLVLFNKNMKSYCLFYGCIIICICLVLFYVLPFNVPVFMILSGITGFFLGGTFNMLAGNQVMAITQGDEKKVDMLSTLIMAVGNLFVGVVEIVIGLALNVKKDYSKESNLFIVLITLCSLTIVIILMRSTWVHKQRRKQSIDAEQAIVSSLTND